MFKKNDVVAYRSDVNWCRHGIAVIFGGEGHAYARDTYWGIGDTYSDSGWVREEDLKEPTLLGNLDEFEASEYLDFDEYLPFSEVFPQGSAAGHGSAVPEAGLRGGEGRECPPIRAEDQRVEGKGTQPAHFHTRNSR